MNPSFYLRTPHVVGYACGSAPCEITEHVFLGDANTITGGRLQEFGITALLNVAVDLEAINLKGYICDKVSIVDGPNPPDLYLAAAGVLSARVDAGNNVLVYCHGGISRSVAVVLFYLNAADPQGWDYWLSFIHEKKWCNPHAAHKQVFESIEWDKLAEAIHEDKVKVL